MDRQKLGIRLGKPDPETCSFVDDDGMRHIVFPQRSVNLTFGGFSEFHCVTYHPYAGEAWLFDYEMSELDDWDSIMLLAMTLKPDGTPGIRVRGTDTRGKDSERWARFDFEVLL